MMLRQLYVFLIQELSLLLASSERRADLDLGLPIGRFFTAGLAIESLTSLYETS